MVNKLLWSPRKTGPWEEKKKEQKEQGWEEEERGGTKRMIGDRACGVLPKPMFEDLKSPESLRAN